MSNKNIKLKRNDGLVYTGEINDLNLRPDSSDQLIMLEDFDIDISYSNNKIIIDTKDENYGKYIINSRNINFLQITDMNDGKILYTIHMTGFSLSLFYIKNTELYFQIKKKFDLLENWLFTEK